MTENKKSDWDNFGYSDMGLRIQQPLPHQSRLKLTEEFSIFFTKPQPNAWFRFWYKFFLGWEWSPIDADGESNQTLQ